MTSLGPHLGVKMLANASMMNPVSHNGKNLVLKKQTDLLKRKGHAVHYLHSEQLPLRGFEYSTDLANLWGKNSPTKLDLSDFLLFINIRLELQYQAK